MAAAGVYVRPASSNLPDKRLGLQPLVDDAGAVLTITGQVFGK